MPTLVVRVSSIVGYKPPEGFKIAKIKELSDGTYEVTLEPPLVG
jgi:hypothetical protein